MRRCLNPKQGSPRCRRTSRRTGHVRSSSISTPGDLEAVVALCEPEARFVARSGDTVIGRDPMREVLAGMIRSKTRLQSRVIKAIPSATSRLYTPTFRAQQPMTWERRSPSVTRPSRSCAARMMAPGSSLLDATVVTSGTLP